MPSPSTSASRPDPGTDAPRSIADVLDWLRDHFLPERARDLSITYQFELRGERGGSLFARVHDGQLEVGEGALPEADSVFRLDADALFGVLGARVNADLLFMEGELEIDGDLSLALKLRALFGAST